MIHYRFGVFLAAVTMLAGCCIPGTGCPGEYSHRILNETPSAMTDLTVRWNSNGQEYLEGPERMASCLGGGLGRYSNYWPEPIPGVVDISWRSQDGAEHDKHIELAAQIPNSGSFTGTIVYKLYENDVVVAAVPKWLENRNRRLGKSTVP